MANLEPRRWDPPTVTAAPGKKGCKHENATSQTWHQVQYSGIKGKPEHGNLLVHTKITVACPCGFAKTDFYDNEPPRDIDDVLQYHKKIEKVPKIVKKHFEKSALTTIEPDPEPEPLPGTPSEEDLEGLELDGIEMAAAAVDETLTDNSGREIAEQIVRETEPPTEPIVQPKKLDRSGKTWWTVLPSYKQLQDYNEEIADLTGKPGTLRPMCPWSRPSDLITSLMADLNAFTQEHTHEHLVNLILKSQGITKDVDEVRKFANAMRNLAPIERGAIQQELADFFKLGILKDGSTWISRDDCGGWFFFTNWFKLPLEIWFPDAIARNPEARDEIGRRGAKPTPGIDAASIAAEATKRDEALSEKRAVRLNENIAAKATRSERAKAAYQATNFALQSQAAFEQGPHSTEEAMAQFVMDAEAHVTEIRDITVSPSMGQSIMTEIAYLPAPRAEFELDRKHPWTLTQVNLRDHSTQGIRARLVNLNDSGLSIRVTEEEGQLIILICPPTRGR